MNKNIFRILAIIVIASAWLGYFSWKNYRTQHNPKPQHITCYHNLRQIGIVFQIWAGDNKFMYPCNVSTNDGGTLELVETDKDGFDKHAVLFLKKMRGDDYLTTPKLLVCPQDILKKTATNWSELLEENITYHFQSGTLVYPGNQKAVLAVCPVDGNILYCDGWVTDKTGNLPPEEKNSAIIREEPK
jgi:hypothetical protein